MTRIKRLRVARGWSQRRMGRHLGISQAQVSRIESGVSGEAGAVSRLLAILEAGRLEAPDDKSPPTATGPSSSGADDGESPPTQPKLSTGRRRASSATASCS